MNEFLIILLVSLLIFYVSRKVEISQRFNEFVGWDTDDFVQMESAELNMWKDRISRAEERRKRARKLLRNLNSEERGE